MNKIYQEITKKNSKTFYYSTLLFPKEIKEKVFLVYAFVRTVDDLVDQKKPQIKKLKIFIEKLNQYWKGEKNNNQLIEDFVKLAKENFSKKWIDDFLKTQLLDCEKKTYTDFKEFNQFTYGVAGVIGFFLSAILKLPKNTYSDAVKLGQSMQIINCCRDVLEDYHFGKIYIPKSLLKKYNLNFKNFLKEEKRENLFKVIKYLLNYAFRLEKKARKSFVFFDKRSLLAVKTASDLYHYIGELILKNPSYIFNRSKLKIKKLTIIKIIFKNLILLYGLNRKN